VGWLSLPSIVPIPRQTPTLGRQMAKTNDTPLFDEKAYNKISRAADKALAKMQDTVYKLESKQKEKLSLEKQQEELRRTELLAEIERVAVDLESKLVLQPEAPKPVRKPRAVKTTKGNTNG